MQSSEVLYVCGLNIPTPQDPRVYAFKLVKSSEGRVYSAHGEDEARKLFSLCKHHSSLYRVDEDRLVLVQRGERRDVDPVSVRKYEVHDLQS